MKHHRYALPLCALILGLISCLPVTAADDDSRPALTARQYPYRFSPEKPFTAKSQFLLQFNAPVSPSAARRYLQLYDKPNERFAEIKATRPSVDEITDLKGTTPAATPLDHFLLIEPAFPLPLEGTWYLFTRAGFSSSDDTHEVAEGRLDFVARLSEFRIESTQALASYDTPLQLAIKRNKQELAPDYTTEELAGLVTLSPRPENYAFDAQRGRFVLTGDFRYGIDYTVTVAEGLIGLDETRLDDSYTETVRFEPNDGFVTFPSFATTQSATGHRNYDIKIGNLTGLRTRAKSLRGDRLILALEEYDSDYEGWGDKLTTPFAMIPGETIYDEFATTTAEIDHTEIITVDWSELGDDSMTGAYYLCSEGKSSTGDGRAVGAQALIQLTNIGLTWKQSPEGTLVYAFHLDSGTPIPEMELRLVDSTAAPLFAGTTDAEGTIFLASDLYPDGNETRYLDAVDGTDRHVIRFNQYLRTSGLWSFGIDQRYDELIEGERRTLIFTDRNVYKPGEEVKLKAISRFVDEDGLLGAGTGRATLKIHDAQYREFVTREVTFGASGSYDDSFTLPAGGLGWHSVELDFNPADTNENERDWNLVQSYSFQVEEYRVNTFEVDLAAPTDTSTFDVALDLSAKYYMGKPLSKAETVWSAYARSQFPRPRGFDEFQFGDRIEEEETFSTEGEIPLTSKGTAGIEFTLPGQPLAPGPRSVNVTAQVTDANQQTISDSARFTVHSSDFYLGLRRPEGVHRAGDTTTFSLAAVTTSGTAHLEAVETGITVEREIWNTVKVLGANGRMTHRNESSLETVSDETISLLTEIDPVTRLTRSMPHEITFQKAGDYRITLTARDSEGRRVITRSRFTVIGAEEPSWSWHDVTRIDLIPDKTTYTIGDTAKLLARSPVFGFALLTTERGGLRSHRTIEISEYETVIEIPIQKGDAPNLFASLLIFRGSDRSPHVHRAVDYRLGYCEIEVDDPTTTLDIRIDRGEARSYQPGETVEVKTTVTDAAGDPISDAEITLYAVDEGVLSLTGHTTPDPQSLFHAAFPLAVGTGQSLGDLLPENPAEQDFVNKGYVIGGGGFSEGLDPDKIRKGFKALAFWKPSLITDENGIATTSFVAPDNLTTFRIMAIVASDNRFGHSEAPVIVNKPLIIEPAVPGFTNVTDQIDLSAVLHNNTDIAQEIEVTVVLDDHAIFLAKIGDRSQTALDEPDAVSRTVSAFLDPGATETLSFPIALTEVGEAKWSWSVRSKTDESLRDATESTLQVGYPLPLLRETHTFTIRNADDLENALAGVESRLLAGTGEVELSLANTRLIGAADALDYLLQYPYGCVEQTTSSLIPWLSTEALQPVMPQHDQSDDEITTTIEKGIARLFSMQTSDGGLGYWPGANQSVLWGSAYGGFAIALAAEQGIAIPGSQSEALWKYLAKNLRNAGEAKDAYALSQRCLALVTLAFADLPEVGYYEVLFEKRSSLSSEARSLLALAMIESGSGTPAQLDALLSPDPNLPVAEVSWYKQPYLAATRLFAQVRHDPSSARVDTLVDDLMQLRQPRDGWGSTYSNAWPLLALAEYASATESQPSANNISIRFGDEEKSVSLGEDPQGKTLTLPFDADITKEDLTISPDADAPVFVNLTIATRPKLMPVEPEQRGFSILRRYEKVELDGNIAAAESLTVGDLILVTLDLNIPNERENYLAIDDPLPAIFEAMNPDFKSQATQKVNTERQIRKLYTNHSEIRKDRVVFFADSVFRSGDYTLQYLARVVAPGEVTAPAAKIEAMYEPQRFGLSSTSRISAAPREIETGKVAAR